MEFSLPTGLATGLTKDIVKDIADDPNYWVRELAGAAAVLEFWPGKATPKDLEKLAKAAPEAFAGKAGARSFCGRVGHAAVGELDGHSVPMDVLNLSGFCSNDCLFSTQSIGLHRSGGVVGQ